MKEFSLKANIPVEPVVSSKSGEECFNCLKTALEQSFPTNQKPHTHTKFIPQLILLWELKALSNKTNKDKPF